MFLEAVTILSGEAVMVGHRVFDEAVRTYAGAMIAASILP